MKHWLITLKCDVGETSFYSHNHVMGRKPNVNAFARRFFNEAGGTPNTNSNGSPAWVFELSLGLSVVVSVERLTEITEDEADILMRLGVI